MTALPVRDAWLLPTLERLLTPEQGDELRDAVTDSYWEAAVRRGFTTDADILSAVADRFRLKIAVLSAAHPQARDLLPEALARKYRVVPVAISDSLLEVATADPTDIDCEGALAFASGRSVRMSLAAPMRIAECLDELYRPASSAIERILENVSDNYDVQSIADPKDEETTSDLGAAERPVIRLVDYLIAEGITTRASDIHLEPEEDGLAVRYRIDGVLKQTMKLPRAVGVPLVSRVKIMAQLDIADRMRPQDGRARVSVNGKPVDLRVSTLPAAHGEKVVIRILDAGNTVLEFPALGLLPEDEAQIQKLINLREGMVLVTGPTGSGKTTTLYTALRAVKARGVNIVTVEDPVEYRLAGIVQVQVNEKAGLTFAGALRSILRQDPDVVLVGEIRDKETATIAVQAALTGHLVLSTLHTIDAASSVARLVDIGIESYKLGAALKGMIAQRLVRRLCPACRQPANDKVPDGLRRWIPEGTAVFEAVGCNQCSTTGYRGRAAVNEILIVDGELERLISSGAAVDQVVASARGAGMRSLWVSGMGQIAAGVTSVDEVLRVLEMPQEERSERARAPENGSRGQNGKRGTAAFVSPPAAPAPAPSHETVGGAFELVDGLSHEEGGASEGGVGRVLLVEDEEPLRRVLKDLLTREGFTVLEAGDGVAALVTVDRDAPDVVVLDINLPRMDGYAVLSRLRARRETATLPVLVLTAREDEEAEVRVFELGADDYLSKPFRPRALIARLRALLRRTVTDDLAGIS